MNETCPRCKSIINDKDVRFCEVCGEELIVQVEDSGVGDADVKSEHALSVSKELLKKLITDSAHLQEIEKDVQLLDDERVALQQGAISIPSSQRTSQINDDPLQLVKKTRKTKRGKKKEGCSNVKTENTQPRADILKVLAPIADNMKEEADFKRKINSLFNI